MYQNNNENYNVNKVRQKRWRQTKIDSFDKDVIQRAIEKVINDTEVITMRKLKHVLLNDNDIDTLKHSFWRRLY